jgi:transcriptional regulator with XRE-family HTH domain
MDIGERLHALRSASKQSLQAVADKVGISKAHVWELEKGHSKNPSFALVQDLADHFGVSIDVLTGASDQPSDTDVHIQRLHRDLSELTDSDRRVVEDMIKSLKIRGQDTA